MNVRIILWWLKSCWRTDQISLWSWLYFLVLHRVGLQCDRMGQDLMHISPSSWRPHLQIWGVMIHPSWSCRITFHRFVFICRFSDMCPCSGSTCVWVTWLLNQIMSPKSVCSRCRGLMTFPLPQLFPQQCAQCFAALCLVATIRADRSDLWLWLRETRLSVPVSCRLFALLSAASYLCITQSYPIELSFISLLHFPHSLLLLYSFCFCISRHPLCRSLPVFVYRWLHVCCVLLCCGRFNNHFVLLATDNEKYEAVKAALLSCEWYLRMSPVTVQLSSLGFRLGLLRLFILVLFTALSRFSALSLLLSSRSTDSLTSPWSLALQLTWKPWDSSDAVL